MSVRTYRIRLISLRKMATPSMFRDRTQVYGRLGRSARTLPIKVMRTFQSILFLLVLLHAHGQGRTTTTVTDSGKVVLHYFTTGEVSTKEWMDTDDRWGRSWAFGRDSRILIDQQTRKVGGHASVSFRYHPNGGVSRVEVSDAPDGGIQWYRSTRTFDEKGDQTSFEEQGWDDRPMHAPHLLPPTTKAPPDPKAPQPQAPHKVTTVKCQRLFVNEVFVVNGSGRPVEITIEPKDQSPALQGSTFVLAPGASQQVGTYSMGEVFVSPVTRMKVIGKVTNRRGKQREVGVLMMEERQVDPQRKAWFYHVLPHGGRVGFGL